MAVESRESTTSQKDAAVSFLRLVASGAVRAAFDQFVSSSFRHHNVYFRGDRESLMRAMEENAAKSPNTTLDVKHVLEDGDFVVVHSHVKPNPADLGAALVHIFRFAGGRVVEAWDVGQPIPKDSPNENGMF
jgi:predicted SnoaL-like aldol condensation-catalyzing enzyme